VSVAGRARRTLISRITCARSHARAPHLFPSSVRVHFWASVIKMAKPHPPRAASGTFRWPDFWNSIQFEWFFILFSVRNIIHFCTIKIRQSILDHNSSHNSKVQKKTPACHKTHTSTIMILTLQQTD
jgi:hypothetical protein